MFPPLAHPLPDSYTEFTKSSGRMSSGFHSGAPGVSSCAKLVCVYRMALYILVAGFPEEKRVLGDQWLAEHFQSLITPFAHCLVGRDRYIRVLERRHSKEIDMHSLFLTYCRA